MTVPLVGGLGTDVDPRMRAPDRLEVARNVQVTEIGGLAKRKGFTSIARTIAGSADNISTNGPVRGLLATSSELLAIGHRNLYAYSPYDDNWRDRGHVSPFVGTTRERFRGEARFLRASLGRSGNFILYAAERQESNDASSIEFRGHDIDGRTLFDPVELDRTSSITTNVAYGPQCAGAGGRVVTIAGQDGGGPDTLRRYTWDAATSHTAPVVATNVTANLYFTVGNARTYDIIGFANGDYIVAYIDNTSRDIELRRFDSSDTQIATGSIAGTFEAVALGTSSLGQFYILTRDDAGSQSVELYARNAISLNVAIFGPTLLETMAANVNAGALSVAEGVDSGGTTRVACSWRAKAVLNTPNEGQHHTRTTDTAGVTTDLLAIGHNVRPYSRPFWYRGRCYQQVSTDVGSDILNFSTIGFETHFLADLKIGDTGGLRFPQLAGLFGVGEAVDDTDFANEGCGSPVVVLPDGVSHRTLAPFIVEADLIPGGSSGFAFREGRDEVEFRFDVAPTSVPIHRGAAVIGGGYVAWYDGTSTFELGFPTAPIPNSVTDSAGSIPAGTYVYLAHWSDQDQLGILHRSVPGPSESITFGIASDVDLAARTTPYTRRDPQRMSCIWHRAGTDPVFRRVNRAIELIPNADADVTPTFTDNELDANVITPLYTTGGILEAAAPEGARIVHIARERLWLADFYRRDRVQYSKFLTPGSAGSVATAPEMFEALGRISERGKEITGLGTLDSATVVFTTDAIFLISGTGPDARGAGDDLSRLTEIPTDTGCVEPLSVVTYPEGICFRTNRGFYELSRGQGISPIGEAVRDFVDDFPVTTSAVVVPEERHIRWTVTNAAGTDGRVMVYDYRVKAWFEWELRRSTDVTIVPVGATYQSSLTGARGTYSVVEADGTVWQEDQSTHYDDATRYVPMVIETGEVQPSGPQAWMSVQEIAALLERVNEHGVRMAIAYNYETTPELAEATWPSAVIESLNNPAVREQLTKKPKTPRSTSIRVRIEDFEDGCSEEGAGFVAHALTFQVAVYEDGPRVESQARM